MITVTPDHVRGHGTQDPDVELMLRVRDGSRDAFDELARRYGPSLTTHFGRSPGLREMAEDLSQEVLFRVYRARRSYVPTASLRTWIARIALNVARNAVRRQSRHPEEGKRSESPSRLRMVARSIADSAHHSPLDRLIQHESCNDAMQVLERMHWRQRRAMKLVSLDEKPIRLAASEMSLSPGALKSLLARARATFRREYRRLQQEDSAADFATDSGVLQRPGESAE